MPISKRLLQLPKWCVPQIDFIMVLRHVKPMISSKHQRMKSGIRIESKEFLANTLIVVSNMLQEQIYKMNSFKKIRQISLEKASRAL